MTAPARHHRRDRGAAIPIVALVLPVLILMTAFAVDLGRQRSSRRSMQAVADVVALDMARVVEGRTLADVQADPATQQALTASAARNDAVNATLAVSPSGAARITKLEWGTLLAGTHDFSPLLASDPIQSTVVPTAVRVTAEETTDYFFQPGEGPVTRTAVASIADEALAQFMMGTTLVNITPPSSWIVGQVLKTVIPGADLVGYQGLANADVTLGDLSTSLGFGSVDELLGSTVSFEDLVVASADALEANGNATAASVLDQLVSLGIQDFQVQVADLIDLGSTGASGADTLISVPQLLLAGVGIADGTHTITIPDTVLNVAGLGEVTLDLTAIDPPIHVGVVDGASGSSDQVDLGLTVAIDVSGNQSQRLCDLPAGERNLVGQLLGGVFQLLNCLLAPLTSAALDVRISGTIDLDLSLSEVTATQSIDCPGSTLRVGYQSSPAAVTAVPSLSVDVTLGGKPLNLLGVSAPAAALAAGGTAGTASFTATDPGPHHTAFNPTTTRVGAPNLGLANLLQVGGLKVSVANVSMPVLGAVAQNLVQPMVNSIVDQVDQLVVAEVSKLLGLNLGGADLTPEWMECEDNTVKLVG